MPTKGILTFNWIYVYSGIRINKNSVKDDISSLRVSVFLIFIHSDFERFVFVSEAFPKLNLTWLWLELFFLKSLSLTERYYQQNNYKKFVFSISESLDSIKWVSFSFLFKYKNIRE